jgi:hypothetical protein
MLQVWQLIRLSISVQDQCHKSRCTFLPTWACLPTSVSSILPIFRSRSICTSTIFVSINIRMLSILAVTLRISQLPIISTSMWFLLVICMSMRAGTYNPCRYMEAYTNPNITGWVDATPGTDGLGYNQTQPLNSFLGQC